jgi:uncharacterized Tic20 family protein
MAKPKPTSAGTTDPGPAYAGTGMGEGEMWKAVATHALGILTTFVGPLLLYFAFRRNASPWLREHLDESLNYWILVTVAFVLLVVLTVLLGTSGAVIFIALLALLIVAVALLFGIISIVKAARGKASHYPLNIKLIK